MTLANTRTPKMGNLTEATIRAAKPIDKPRKLWDVDGLFLLVSTSGAKLWRLKYRIHGREKLLALGQYPVVSLKSARERQLEARRQVSAGIDPSAKRQAERRGQANTFKAVALEWLELQRKSLTEASFEKSRWLLEDLLFPSIGARPIDTITSADLLTPLRKIESRGKHETAHRAKQKAGQVFRYAVSTDRASGDPTSGLRGALAPVSVKHRAAITTPQRIGELLRALDGYDGQPSTCTALRLAPLLFVRPGELRAARWEEFQLDAAEPLWRIPAVRMKMRLEHLVPLPRQAVSLLRDLQPITGPAGLVFPSLTSGARPISENTLNSALRRLGYSNDEMTAHGFRAMASTVLNEQGYPPDIIELQLAHKERNQVRAAYNRATRLPERRKMMQAWADYLDGLRAAVPSPQ